MTLARDHGDGLGLATASFVRGRAAFRENDVATARRLLTDAFAGFRGLDARGRAAWALCFLASIDCRDAIDEGGDQKVLERAIDLCEEALATFRSVDYLPGIIRALHGLADVAYKLRDLPRALALSQEVLSLAWSRRQLVNSYLNDIANIAGRTGHYDLAARLYGAADKERSRHPDPLSPVFRSEVERDRELVRANLGEAAFDAGWEAGHAMDGEQAVQIALAFTVPPIGKPAVSLTPREREILPLLAAGRTDREIGATLYLSHRTVENHVARLRAKLGGARTRAEALETARTIGLLRDSPPAG